MSAQVQAPRPNCSHDANNRPIQPPASPDPINIDKKTSQAPKLRRKRSLKPLLNVLLQIVIQVVANN